MTWHFDAPAARTRQQRTRLHVITDADVLASRLAELEYREGNLVRRLVVLKERHAVTPGEVTWRQVTELDQKLTEARAEIDRLRERLSPNVDR